MSLGLSSLGYIREVAAERMLNDKRLRSLSREYDESVRRLQDNGIIGYIPLAVSIREMGREIGYHDSQITRDIGADNMRILKINYQEILEKLGTNLGEAQKTELEKRLTNCGTALDYDRARIEKDIKTAAKR